MNLDIPSSNQIYEKFLFKVKPLRKDGLVLKIHPLVKNSLKNVRFIKASFHPSSKIVALADNNENTFIVDYGGNKYWKLPTNSCTSMKFSIFNEDELLLGLFGGNIKVLKFESGGVTETIKGHEQPVKNMSFAGKYLLLSSSDEEAILWDLRTYTMLQVLDLDKKSYLKFILFIPLSSNILACFQDDVIQVWNSSKFDTIKNFSLKKWKNFSLKSIAFTKNGQIMVMAGYAPRMVFLTMENWKLYKMVNLSDYIQSVRHIEFIPQPFDAGFNNILAILSHQGKIYFYNVDKNVINNVLRTESEIKHFTVCSQGNHIAALLHCGDTQLFKIQQYIDENGNSKLVKVATEKRKLTSSRSQKENQMLRDIKCELDNILNKDKLRLVLEEYWEYPEIHRLKIWEQLLQLPNNYKSYNTLINRLTSHEFDDLSKKYPLENKVSIIALKKLLSNLVTWCPFFSNVEFIPVLTFPFVKVFQNKPVACFEAICTVMMNWCQHWFEYHPLAPFNILAIIENILYEHDPELLSFFTNSKLSSTIYAWPLLSSAFSEVLLGPEWYCLWDHVFTNEVSFLLCAAAAYNITQREMLMKMNSLEEFKCFFENQNPIDMKRFLKTTYFLLENISEESHPRQYLKEFKGIGEGNYPIFKSYPVILFDLKEGSLNDLGMDLAQSVRYENEILERKQKEEMEKDEADQKAREHEKRIRAMEYILLERIKSKDNLVNLVNNKLLSIKSFVGSKNG